MITLSTQVVERIQSGPLGRYFVVVLDVSQADAPQLATTVVLVDGGDLPGICINVETALGVDMTLTFFQVSFTSGLSSL